MISIIANEFSNYTQPTFYEFIRLQQQTHFEIRFPKESIAGKHKNFDVFYEYYLAAYVGDRLFQIATSFAYYVPATNRIDYFKFEVEVADIEKFTATLFELIFAMYYDEKEEE
jgi:hypothetical protein